MRNILLTIRYNGVRYHGWQVQKNAVTVQGALQDSAVRLFGKRPDFKGCSRTDSGVHANMFCVNFHTDSQIPVSRLPDAFNHFLPNDIVVYDATLVPDDFHARYSCHGKEYKYIIQNSRFDNPFMQGLVYKYERPIDAQLLNTAAKKFIGTYDFSAFCAANDSVEDHTRTIYDCNVSREMENIIVTISGDGFLYNMVRIIVGTLLFVNEGKISAEDIQAIIQSRDRSKAGPTVPPDGLYLNKVYYNFNEGDTNAG